MKRYAGIRYRYKPETYWVEKDVRQSILRDIKGTERRRLIDRALRNGQFESFDDELLESEVSTETRERLGAIHPSLMGGEYLPGYLRGETEIARIELQSTTSDVISIRARGEDGLIHYRVVDEYNGQFRSEWDDSEGPLSLKELIEFIEGTELGAFSGPISLAYNECNVEGCGSRRQLRNFTTIGSDLYPQLCEHYEHVFDDWVAEETD